MVIYFFMQSLLGPILLMKASMPVLVQQTLSTDKNRLKLLSGNNQTMNPPAEFLDFEWSWIFFFSKRLEVCSPSGYFMRWKYALSY